MKITDTDSKRGKGHKKSLVPVGVSEFETAGLVSAYVLHGPLLRHLFT